MREIIALTVKELSGAMLKGEICPKEALEAYLEQIEAEDKKINAYISLDAENALKKAEKIKPDGFLSGIPMAVKDNKLPALPKCWKILSRRTAHARMKSWKTRAVC